MVDPVRPLPPNRTPSTYAEDQNTPLHAACYRGDYHEALLLLLRGADVHARNVWRETPLHQCTSRGHLDVMLLLLDCGASVNALDHDGLTPLHLAVIHANRDSTKLLLWYGSAVFNASHVTNTLHVVQLAQSVHVCHDLVSNAVGRVWSLQHLCRTVIRRSLGARYRLRLKELPLPRHIITFLSTLPVTTGRHESGRRHRGQRSMAALRISGKT